MKDVSCLAQPQTARARAPRVSWGFESGPAVGQPGLRWTLQTLLLEGADLPAFGSEISEHQETAALERPEQGSCGVVVTTTAARSCRWVVRAVQRRVGNLSKSQTLSPSVGSPRPSTTTWLCLHPLLSHLPQPPTLQVRLS